MFAHILGITLENLYTIEKLPEGFYHVVKKNFN